jgi:carbohydrate-selective porin OprB
MDVARLDPIDQKKSRFPKEAAFLKDRVFQSGRLTLGELEALAGSGLAGLFAFTCTWVTAEKTLGLQGGTELGVVKDQSAGDRELDGIGLAVHATSAGDRFDVKLVLQVRDLEGLEKLALQSEGGQDFFERLVIDGDFSGAGG